jgi:malate dehydrogenase
VDVAVIGATGDVGRQVCVQLIERRIVPVSSRLQLVGRAGSASASAVHGLRADLIDAYAEHAPLIDVALRPEDVVADVVVMTAGRTVPSRPGAGTDRHSLTADNLVVFSTFAEALAEHGSGHEVVIVMSKPVELAVAVFAEALGRQRVVGMGAWLDTLRFRHEIAGSLGIRRQAVGGFVVGQHGDGLVPLWSSVRLTGQTVEEREAAVARLRGRRSLDDFAGEIESAKQVLLELAATDMWAAFVAIESLPPDLRTVAGHGSPTRAEQRPPPARPERRSTWSTPSSTDEIVVARQVTLDGEIALGGRGVQTVAGVPIILGPEGWTRVLLDPLAEDEERRLAAVVGELSGSLPALRRAA